MICTIFIHSLFRIRKLTRSLRSIARFLIEGDIRGGGGGGVPNTAIPQEKLANTGIPCRKSTTYPYPI